MLMARYFRRAHFLLLGDPNQAISAGTASFAEIRAVFEATHGEVERCQLMTSYRSSPEITNLFARLAGSDEQMLISSVQREGLEPVLMECDRAQHAAKLREIAERMAAEPGVTAVLAPYAQAAKKLAAALTDAGAVLIDDASNLPSEGLIVLPLKLAKGLEFDRVIIPDASERAFPAEDDLARRRLYTSISRATHEIALVADGKLSSLIA